MKGKDVLISLLILLFIYSCCASKQTTNEPTEEYFKSNNYVAAEIMNPGNMAGCSYLIVIGDKKLEPVNLADSLFIDKLKVWVKYHNEKNKMSACMMGDIVTIDDIKLRK